MKISEITVSWMTYISKDGKKTHCIEFDNGTKFCSKDCTEEQFEQLMEFYSNNIIATKVK